MDRTKKQVQTIHLRLLRVGRQPETSVNKEVTLEKYDRLDGAKIALDTRGGDVPKWSPFLELSDKQKAKLSNSQAFCVVFVPIVERDQTLERDRTRWLAVSFGAAHHILKPDAIRLDFGLLVVLNTVDPDKLRSTDIRALDAHATARRTQTARRANQTAFGIDIRCDILRSVTGEPKNPSFAKSVTGDDVLTLTKKMDIDDLPQVCADALSKFRSTKYKESFPWVEHINYVRDEKTKRLLDGELVDALNDSLNGAIPDTLSLAYPGIYASEKDQSIRYMGFGCQNIHPDLDIVGYVSDMREMACLKENMVPKTPRWSFESKFLDTHKVREENGKISSIRQWLVYETDLNGGEKYVLSVNRWYRIDRALATRVSKFFEAIPKHTLPRAKKDENEVKYTKRIAKEGHKMLSLASVLDKPTGAGARDRVEMCDFLRDDGAMIHIKNKTLSQQLSHLFNQGTVSASVMKTDEAFRNRLREKIKAKQNSLRIEGYGALGTDYEALFADFETRLRDGKQWIVYGAIRTDLGERTKQQIPFFSLITLERTVEYLWSLGYKCAFAWIDKPPSPKTKAKRKPRARTAAATKLKKERLRKAKRNTKNERKQKGRRKSKA